MEKNNEKENGRRQQRDEFFFEFFGQFAHGDPMQRKKRHPHDMRRKRASMGPDYAQ